MAKKTPFQIVKHLRVTEKAMVLQQLKDNNSNPSVAKCKSPKYVFVVDKEANKQEIAKAVEEIYQDKNVRVVDVNTINVKSKQKRLRGRPGKTAAFKKAVVTLEVGDSLE